MSLLKPATSDFPKKAVWVVAVLGLVLRLWFNLLQHPLSKYLYSDMGVYDVRARNLLSGALGPIDTFTPVGYPALLAAVYALTNRNLAVVAGLQAVMGALTIVIAAVVCWRLTSSRKATVATAAVTAGYLPLLSYGGLLMSEVPFCFFTTLSALLLMRAKDNPSWVRLAAAGLVLAVATLIRPQLALLYPLLPFYFWACFRPNRKAALRALAIVLAVSFPFFAAASWHNSRLLGRPTGLGTNGGLNFFLAHSEYRTAEYRKDGKKDGKVEYAITPIPNGIRYRHVFNSPVPLNDESFFYRQGFRLLRAKPLRLVRDLRNVTEGFGLGKTDYWPGWIKYRVLLEIFRRPFFWVVILPILFVCLRSDSRREIFRPEGSDRLLILLLLATVVVTLYVFLGDPRMRVPFDPLLIALAADAYARLAKTYVRTAVPSDR